MHAQRSKIFGRVDSIVAHWDGRRPRPPARPAAAFETMETLRDLERMTAYWEAKAAAAADARRRFLAARQANRCRALASRIKLESCSR